MLILIAIGLFIGIIIIVHLYPSRFCMKELYPYNIKNNVKKNWAILLTTAINVNNKYIERKHLYEQQIIKWLTGTNLNIFVIESTNSKFDLPPHPRLKIIYKDIPTQTSSTISEMSSINEALKYIDIKYNYILKVTGRYYLSDIENHLKNIKDVDIILQKNCFSPFQHTEYFGGKRDIFEKFIKYFDRDNGIMEKQLYKFVIDNNLSFQRMGSFPNNIRRGGDNILINKL